MRVRRNTSAAVAAALLLVALSAHQSWATAVSFVTNIDNEAASNTTFSVNITFSGSCQALVIFFWGGTDTTGVTASVSSQTIPSIANTSTTKTGQLTTASRVLAGILNPALSGTQTVTTSWTTTQAATEIVFLLNNVSGFNNGATAGDSSVTTHTSFPISLNSNASDMSMASVNDPNNATSNFTTITTSLGGSSCGNALGACVGDHDSGAGGSPVTHTFTLIVGSTAGWALNAVNAVQTGVGCAAPGAGGPGPGWLPNLGVGLRVPHSIWDRLSRRLRHIPLIPNWGPF